jgi:hypothetical protein
LPKKWGRWQSPANLTKVAQYPGYKSKVTFALLPKKHSFALRWW